MNIGITERKLPSIEARVKRRRSAAAVTVMLWLRASRAEKREIARKLSRKNAAHIGAVVLEAGTSPASERRAASLEMADYLANERWNEADT